uniref:Uncharacterized protein n=1 Tax=Buteo japonicus TaxID=224669 RepID=A0A8C0C1D8_9AVES
WSLVKSPWQFLCFSTYFPIVKKKWCLEFKTYSTAFGGFLSMLSTRLVSSAVSGTLGQLMCRAAHGLPCSAQVARQWQG